MVLVVLVAACSAAPAQPAAKTADQPVSTVVATQNRTVSMAVRYENGDLHPKTLTPGLSAFTKRAFNAALTLIDTKGDTRPYLAESVPQLNTASWRVSPDGRMVTTYRLRPSPTRHHGTPLR